MVPIRTADWNFMWIGGERVFLEETMDVINPSTGEVIGRVPKGGEKETKLAIDAAEGAFPLWSRIPADKRADYLQDWASRILAHKEELAELLTQEQGKPLSESLGEIEGSAEFIRWYAEEGKRAYGEIIPPSKESQRILVMRQPVGVAGLITPWNFPAAMVTRKTAPALAAGCTVVLKPAKQTPQIAIALFQHLMETGIPGGTANLVTGDASAIGDTLLSDNRVRKISFTGSTQVGKHLMRQAADQVKRLSLELGGNAPAIVFPDADLEKAAESILANKFENCGQVCNGINVIYAHTEIAEALTEKLVSLAASIKVGDGMEPGVQAGPLIDKQAVMKVEELLREAVENGAEIKVGGTRLLDEKYRNGSYFAPTILTKVTQGMRIVQEEIFGPVAPVVTFDSEEEVLKAANETPYGLSAYFFTRDVGRVFRFVEGLEFGMVAVNGTSLSLPQAPFGGIKQSGSGREGGHHGLEEYLDYKYVSLTVD
jgi:succinate-semialdehyde dehydrogenase/glutarate-semialdehyde dehydrogenase